jgi:outer membrane protein OmpA-like peptidoglycan-associated protein
LPWKNENEAEKLAKAAGILIAYPGLNIAVGGYTDNVGGGDEMNQKLSETRAGGVRDYLVQRGVGGKLSKRDRLWKEFAGGLRR